MLPVNGKHIEDAKLTDIVYDQISNLNTDIRHYITVRTENGEEPDSAGKTWHKHKIGVHEDEIYVATKSHDAEGVAVYDVTELQDILDSIAAHVEQHNLYASIPLTGERMDVLCQHGSISIPDELQ